MTPAKPPPRATASRKPAASCDKPAPERLADFLTGRLERVFVNPSIRIDQFIERPEFDHGSSGACV
jgi:hypothetical protein